MPRYQQFFQFVGVGLPFLGLPLAIWLLWGHGVSAADLAIMASLYTLTGLGIGVGYHRLLTHRSFETSRGLRYMWAILGSLALEGSVIPWIAHHRSGTRSRVNGAPTFFINGVRLDLGLRARDAPRCGGECGDGRHPTGRESRNEGVRRAPRSLSSLAVAPRRRAAPPAPARQSR
jgi:hypothetical protein